MTRRRLPPPWTESAPRLPANDACEASRCSRFRCRNERRLDCSVAWSSAWRRDVIICNVSKRKNLQKSACRNTACAEERNHKNTTIASRRSTSQHIRTHNNNYNYNNITKHHSRTFATATPTPTPCSAQQQLQLQQQHQTPQQDVRHSHTNTNTVLCSDGAQVTLQANSGTKTTRRTQRANSLISCVCVVESGRRDAPVDADEALRGVAPPGGSLARNKPSEAWRTAQTGPKSFRRAAASKNARHMRASRPKESKGSDREPGAAPSCNPREGLTVTMALRVQPDRAHMLFVCVCACVYVCVCVCVCVCV